MSSLLEQAIIDAAALREAAIKNAESAILNKYSADIREAVDSLLEQEDETVVDTATDSTESEALTASITYGLEAEGASTEQEIVLSMEELKDMAEVLADAEADLVGDGTSHEELASNVQDGTLTPPPEMDAEVSTVAVDATLNEEEIDIEDIDNLLEELVVDIAPQKEGWAGTPEDIMNYKEEMELARRAATDAEEQVQDLKSAGERLSEQNEHLGAQNTKLVAALKALKENFEKVNLSNARLLYTNRILTNDSLNERQKTKIVEALSNADSIEEAKVIFETLQSAVGSVRGKTRPQSLRETVERPTATLPRRETKNSSGPVTDRMQVLAGIKKLK